LKTSAFGILSSQLADVDYQRYSGENLLWNNFKKW